MSHDPYFNPFRGWDRNQRTPVISWAEYFRASSVFPFPAAWLEYPARAYPKPPRRVVLAPMLRPARAQARACRLDRGRWKRRRFVQRLRTKPADIARVEA